MAWVGVDDVKGRWVGDDWPDSPDVVHNLIGDAEQFVSHEYPDIGDRIDSGDLPVGRVVMVVAQMVIRVLRNPKGLRQVQTTTGPFQDGGTFGGTNPGVLTLTDEERSLLGYTPGAPRQRAFSIPLAPPRPPAPEWWK